MNEVVVKVNNLVKTFGKLPDCITAVADISFSLRRGEIVGFLGPNGAGKTTTIQILLGLITPTSGTIEIFGKTFQHHREEILSKMNFSSTYTHLPYKLTVWENLYIVALLYSVTNPKQKVEDTIKRMQLESVAKKQIGELSSGWITRINLARTFLNDPQFILLDEPTASLDPEGAAEIRSEILKKKKSDDTTIIWTSHNMAEVEEVCDRVIFLQKGRIVAEDTPEGLAKTIKSCRVSFMIQNGKIRFLSLSKTQNWKAIESGRFIIVELKEKEIPNLLHFLSHEQIEYSEIAIDKPTLEDFFLTISETKQNVG